MKILVIGAGVMGSQIAIFLGKIDQYEISIFSQEYNYALPENIRKIPVINANITTEYDIVIEAVAEDYVIKAAILNQCHPKFLLASNTSSLSIGKLSAALRDNGDNFLGLHFMNPVEKIPLVELIPHRNTTPQTVIYAKKIINSWQKTPIIVPDIPGFVINRILICAINEAIKIKEHTNISVEDIDKIMHLGANHKMGPLQLADFIGLDIVLAIIKNMNCEENYYQPAKLLVEMVSRGQLGRKTQEGFYNYQSI